MFTSLLSSNYRCLGIKSPFIEFRADFELLSNESISLNITEKIPDARQRKTNFQNLGNFINPINRDEKTFKGINNTTFSLQSDLLDAKDAKKQQEKHLYQLQQQQIQELQQHNLNKTTTNKILMDIIKPIVTENESNGRPDHSTIQIIANSNADNHHEQMASRHSYDDDDSRDRKIIMPLALKTTLIERERPIPTPSPTLAKPQSNIDDLKNHLLMLQNYSDVDKSFQNKFVVFKKSTIAAPTTTTTSTTMRTTTMPFPMTMYRTKPSINIPLQNSQILRDVSYPFSRAERVTVVPQVFLQNDQQQPDSDDERAIEERRKNRKNEKKIKKERKQKNKNKETNNKLQNMIPPTSTAAPSKKSIRREQRKRIFNAQQTPIRYEKSLNGSQVLIAGSRTTVASNVPYIINLNDKQIDNENPRKLSRTIRSKSQTGGRRRNQQNKMQRDIIMPVESAYSSSGKNQSNERVDLNPKYCYDVNGLSKGQQKICEQYTNIMPAISRGARAAIQVRRENFFLNILEDENCKKLLMQCSLNYL